MQVRNDNTFSMFHSIIHERYVANQLLILSSKKLRRNDEYKFDHEITNIFPPKSLLCYEAQRVQEKRVTFAPTYLYQKSLRISLVKKAINKHNLFINKNLKLSNDDNTIQIQ